MLPRSLNLQFGAMSESALPLREVVQKMGPPHRDRTEELRLTEVEDRENRDGIDGVSVQTAAERACAGDSDAFHAIFKRYGRPVMAFIYHMTGDRATAEELAQETFLRAFRGLHRMQSGVRLSTWLFGIARNVAREAIREKRRNRREVGWDDGFSATLGDARSGPDDSILSLELGRAIRDSLQSLSDDQRVVFVLKLVHKMRYEEISGITGSSIGKLKTDLHRARHQMRENLMPYLEGQISGLRGGL